MKYLIIILLLTPIFGNSQSIQSEINEQVWKTFIKAYSTNDAELFNSIHSDDVLRVSSRGIRKGDEYKKSMSDYLNGMQEKGQKMTIDFSFEKRIHKEDIAYEVGIYKLTRLNSNESNDYYGRFHVVLKKIQGVWKIVQDYDTSEVLGKRIDKESFNIGKEMSHDFSR